MTQQHYPTDENPTNQGDDAAGGQPGEAAPGAHGPAAPAAPDPPAGAENFDPREKLTGDDPDEVMQTGYDPPDREPHSLRRAPTAAEERGTPSTDERLAEEEPDVDERERRRSQDAPRAGRLVAPDEGTQEHPSDAPDEIAADVGPAGYAASAEEAAVHVVDPDDEP